ncbi:hypothetical protein SNE40_017552 [Patella caerulea]|uniref:Potassium channel domain-containing protein n=2 Tax=Patella caerulea TaxID=87958 RepID=A0AAN8JCG1_PATCE
MEDYTAYGEGPPSREIVPLTESMTEGSVTMESMESSYIQTSTATLQAAKFPVNTCWGKFVTGLKTIYSWVSSLVGLLLLLVVYTVIGAFIFRAIEAPHEKLEKKNIIVERKEMIEVLVNITKAAHGLNDSEMTKDVAERLTNYELTIYDAYKNGITTISTEHKWNIWTALFYCGTIYTTIGYGHISPATDLGRVLTIIYAVIGIPLALIALADIGRKFTVGLKFVYAFVRQVYYWKCCNRVRTRHRLDITDAAAGTKVANGTEVRPGVKVYFGYEISTEFNIPIFVVAFIILLYLFLGAGMYTLWEDWTYLEAIYFVFISISTIGFGDVIPAHPKFFLLSSVYVFIGLSLISMSINVAIEFFNQQIGKAKVNLGKASGRAREKAVEKIHDVNRTLTKARDRMHDIGKKRSFEEHEKDSPERQLNNGYKIRHKDITKGGNHKGSPRADNHKNNQRGDSFEEHEKYSPERQLNNGHKIRHKDIPKGDNHIGSPGADDH